MVDLTIDDANHFMNWLKEGLANNALGSLMIYTKIIHELTGLDLKIARKIACDNCNTTLYNELSLIRNFTQKALTKLTTLPSKGNHAADLKDQYIKYLTNIAQLTGDPYEYLYKQRN